MKKTLLIFACAGALAIGLFADQRRAAGVLVVTPPVTSTDAPGLGGEGGSAPEGTVVNTTTPTDLDFLIFDGTSGTNSKPLAVTGTGRGVKSSGATVTNLTHVGTLTQTGSTYATEDYPNGVLIQSTGNLNKTNDLPVVNNSNVVFKATITDGAASAGTAGQVLKSTATATAWSSAGGFSFQGGAGLQAAPADGATHYLGPAFTIAGNTTQGRYRFGVPVAATIKAYRVMVVITGTLASSENVTVALWLNNTTAVGSHTEQWTANPTHTVTGGLSQAVSTSDTLELRLQYPTWATDPTNVLVYFQVYFEPQ